MEASDAIPVHPNAPGWFRRALEVPYESDHVEVDGTAVHYLAWGEAGRPGLVLVHGGGAHAHWWHHVAPGLAKEYRVVAMDMSGHGDSGRRDRYDFLQWSEEVLAVAAPAGIAGRPVVVGHSLGGMVAMALGATRPDALAGLIVVDSAVTEPEPEVEQSRMKEAFGKVRTYETLDDAVERFRTIPPQRHYLDYVRDHVARRSLRRDGERWVWKFDRHVFDQFDRSPRAAAFPYLQALRCRFAILASEHGLVTPEVAAAMYDELGRVTPVVELPEAGHHPMLDVPLTLLTALRALLADWEHSTPDRRD